MKKVKLKKKNKHEKLFSIMIVLIIIIIISISLIIKLEEKINNRILTFCETEANKVSKMIVLEAVNNFFSEDIDTYELLQIEKNKDGQIQQIGLDTRKVNQYVSNINKKVKQYFSDIENETSNIIDLKKNLLTNSDLLLIKKGLVFEIPFGIVTNSTFLSNLGPKIPVRLILSGDLESNISTKIESYGINNMLFIVYLNIKVTERILLPISTKTITIDNNIPIITRMIQGEIPNYFLKT